MDKLSFEFLHFTILGLFSTFYQSQTGLHYNVNKNYKKNITELIYLKYLCISPQITASRKAKTNLTKTGSLYICTSFDGSAPRGGTYTLFSFQINELNYIDAKQSETTLSFYVKYTVT